MKSLILLFLGILIFTGCEKKNGVEIIPDYNSMYYTSENIDQPPRLIDGDENKLHKDIQKEMVKNSQDKINLKYKFFISEEGRVEKILPVITPELGYTNLVANAVSSWKFEPGKKDSKSVKSQYSWAMNIPAETDIEDSAYIITADTMPQIIGGLQALSNNVVYPEKAKQSGTEGRVYIQVYLDESGKVVKSLVIKSAGELLDNAALSAIKKTRFTPAIVNGKPVKAKIVVPIFFKLS
ncbi:MAG TPA: energy transducer TonB [Ignavibacteriaceae bacterium]|nr:energy transducer TonB [Ignavibacteriaceae bacterium]